MLFDSALFLLRNEEALSSLPDTLKPDFIDDYDHARNKLKAYKGPKVECEIKDKYKRTKYLGIEYCKWMISENGEVDQEYRDLLEESKKKDDLADAYLQGMYWLTK